MTKGRKTTFDELLSKKTRGNNKDVGLSLGRHKYIYQATKEENEEHGYPIIALCKFGKVSREAYYKWLHREISENDSISHPIADEIEKIHEEFPDKRY